jgi:hypothetical protein
MPAEQQPIRQARCRPVLELGATAAFFGSRQQPAALSRTARAFRSGVFKPCIAVLTLAGAGVTLARTYAGPLLAETGGH